jgi:hypothetical protein
MYAVTSIPLVNRTRAIFRRAEFGFLGVVVVTFVHTPRLNGDGYLVGWFIKELNPRLSATAFGFVVTFVRPFLISWLIFGIIINTFFKITPQKRGLR